MTQERFAPVAPPGPPPPDKPPGPIHLALTVSALVVLGCAILGWGPPGDDPLLYGAPAGLALALAGLIWMIRTLHVVGENRRWSWWISAAPSAVAAAAVAILLAPQADWDDARPAFDRISAQVHADPDRPLGAMAIGGFRITGVSAGPNGEVYFFEDITDQDPGYHSTSTGWVHSPNGRPTAFDRNFSARPLDDGWYRFSSSW